jgi:hypothetical protein
MTPGRSGDATLRRPGSDEFHVNHRSPASQHAINLKRFTNLVGAVTGYLLFSLKTGSVVATQGLTRLIVGVQPDNRKFRPLLTTPAHTAFPALILLELMLGDCASIERH